MPFLVIISGYTLDYTSGGEVLVRVLSMGQMDLFKNYSYSVGLCAPPQKKKTKTKNQKNKTKQNKKQTQKQKMYF